MRGAAMITNPQAAQEHFTDKITRLVRENAEAAERITTLESELSNLNDQMDEHLKQWEICKQQRDAAVHDAERYRWLIDGNGMQHCDDNLPYIAQDKQDSWGNYKVQILEPDEANDAIDAARSRERGEETT